MKYQITSATKTNNAASQQATASTPRSMSRCDSLSNFCLEEFSFGSTIAPECPHEDAVA
jgi:hypothetical protein